MMAQEPVAGTTEGATMRVLKAVGSFIRNFMILFSFIVSLVLVIVLIVAGLLIFEIKNTIATPLVNGLHSSFVGLDQATIDWTIPVRDRIPVILNIPLQTDTIVVLTEPVPLTVSATIELPGIGTLDNAQVALELPSGLELPVRLDLNVPVDEELDVSLDVRAVIPLRETQLHDPFDNLRLLFEPFTRGLANLPDNFTEAGEFAQGILRGEPINLLADNPYNDDPWLGFSRTAGFGYTLGSEPVPPMNVPLETGIVAQGGIPPLDQQLRPDLYADSSNPTAYNNARTQAMIDAGIPPAYFNGDYVTDVYAVQRAAGAQPPADLGFQPVPPAFSDPNAGLVPVDPNAVPPDPNAAPAFSDPNAGLVPVDPNAVPPDPNAAPAFSDPSLVPADASAAAVTDEMGQGGGVSQDDLGIISPTPTG